MPRQQLRSVFRRLQETKVARTWEFDDTRVWSKRAQDRGGLSKRFQFVFADQDQESRPGMRQFVRVLRVICEAGNAEIRDIKLRPGMAIDEGRQPRMEGRRRVG